MVFMFIITTASPALAEVTDYDRAVDAYVEYNCDYNARTLIKEGSKTPDSELTMICKKGAVDIKKFLTDWPDFGTSEGIISFQNTVAPCNDEKIAECAYKNQIYQYGAGSWGIGYTQSAAAKANTIRQWKQGKFKVN